MCEIHGMGLDVCGIERMIPQLSKPHFLSRILTTEEIAYLQSRGAAAADTLAGLYAAKEAVLKALGCGLTFPLTDVVIDHTPQGQPTVRLQGEIARKYQGKFLLTITHDAGVAAAAAIYMA